MHYIEPFYNWRHYYISEEDDKSPFYMREYNEFYFDKAIYNYYIHPQWDNIGSSTLYVKIIFIDYEKSFVIIELIGEWNDCITNDIMHLKRGVMDTLIANGINKCILICENILNFHYESHDYYEEWIEDVEDGWIAAINIQQHVLEEFVRNDIDQYFVLGGELNILTWRTFEPQILYTTVEKLILRRLKPPGYNII